MRGNETTDTDSIWRLSAKFPIPMRGNETMFEATFAIAAKVSNPHEG